MTDSTPERFGAARHSLVVGLESAGIHDPAVLAAFARVPRERFVPPDLVEHAYEDEALGIGHGQTISQPYIVARMTELLRLRVVPRPDGTRVRVLDVGTGSGYQAAILAAMGAEVVSIERDAELSSAAERRLGEVGLGDRVECVVGDGTEGWLGRAPYDGIVVAAASPQVPPPLLDQLASGGRLVIPIGPRDHQSLHALSRVGDAVEDRVLDPCVFVPLVGRFGFQ
ncbi:MAG: protein-L-isoaspartate(D-aspartate) O-methyltransferase [Chloroflexi bacterium]|nr:protein-L-isoaspartate(D-aspartate) O-methyltransferase [Chloroflexota bacterium]